MVRLLQQQHNKTTVNEDDSITTTTTVDKTDHANNDNHTTTITQTTTALDENLQKKITRQIEYYFGDVNMVRDKFLRIETQKEEGWIPLSILTTFKRLQSLTTDHNIIMNALKRSFSGLLQLDEKENKIRRDPSKPIPASQAELEQLLRNRTVYVKGFPKNSPSQIKLDDLLIFFEKYGATDNIQMQRNFKTKEFNGCVFVVFPTDEEAKHFVSLSKQTPPIKYNDQSILECELQDNFLKRKEQETGADGSSSKANVSIREQRQQEKQMKKDKRKEEMDKKTNQHAEKLNREQMSGALIHIKNMPEDGTRELIKAKFSPFTKLPWIDYNKGETQAWVRLNEAFTAKDVLDKVLAAYGGKLEINSTEVEPRVVEGEEELKFWKEANEKRAEQRTKKRDGSGRQNKRGGRGGGDRRGGRNGRFGDKRKRNDRNGGTRDEDGDSNDSGDEQEQTSKRAKKLETDFANED